MRVGAARKLRRLIGRLALSAAAVAIAGGKLIVVGSDSDALATAGSSTEVIDAGGATVMPGIHDGHIALANSRALEIAGIDSSTKNPPGGEIRKDGKGEPTGLLLDDAIYLVSTLLPQPTAEDNADAMAAGYEVMSKMGVTSCLHAAVDETEVAAMAVFADRGPLPMRTHLALQIDSDDAVDTAAMLDRIQHLRDTYGRPSFDVDTVKMFFDGVIEYPTQTAALLRPYRVNKGTKKHPRWVKGTDRGPTYWSQEVAHAAIAAVDAAGWRVHLHAIGDRAVREGLDSFAVALATNGPSDKRHTISHLELVDPADFKRFAQLNVMASMQMQWAERDSYTVDKVQGYLGPQRYKHLYPAGSLKDGGALLCGGSDWPVDPLLPLRQIEMAINRTADEVYGGYHDPLFKTQGISLPASIAMHTRNSAYQLHQESITGRLRPGMDADLIVLDQDILGVPLTRVSKSKVRLTMVGGRTTHRSDI